METISYSIQNLKCGGCAAQISSQLLKIEGVENVVVNEDESNVDIDCMEYVDQNEIIETLSEIGYPLMDAENSLGKKAKSYVSCMIGRVKNSEN